MARRLAVASMVMGVVALMAGPSAAQIDAPAETAAFQGRVNQYVQMHRRLEGPLPPLPHELRYMALSKALLIWDHHADLVVEMVPGLFDPLTYSKKKTIEAHETGRLQRRE